MRFLIKQGWKLPPLFPREKVIPEGQTSENLQIGIEKNSKSCAEVDSKIETLLKKMLYNTVSMADVFRLVDLEIEWRTLNNVEPQFKRELKLWQRLQDKVNLLK